MKNILVITLSIAFSGFAFSQNKAINSPKTINANELAMLIGNWEGSLMYLDYTSNKPNTIPSNLVIEAGKNENQLKVANFYPGEPKANNNYKITISKDGTQINKQDIKTKTNEPNGSIKVIVEYNGKDGNDNKKALFRISYLLSEKKYTVEKEVLFEGTEEWILRNRYSYEKK